MKTIVITAFLLFGAAAASAQEDSLPSFYFTSPLDLQSGRDVGVLDGTQKVDDTTVILTGPTLKFWKPSPRSDFSLTYEPQFELFTHYGSLSSWNHEAELNWDYKITSRWSIDSTDRFVATRDDSLRFDSAFLLPRGPYKENAAFVKLHYDLSPETQITLHVDSAFASFRQDDVTNPILFSRLTDTYGLSAEHHFGPKSKLTGDYSYLLSYSFDPYDSLGARIAPYPPTHAATLTYDYNWTPTLLLEVSGGYVHNVINSYVASGLVEKHFNRVVISGDASRYLSYFASPATPGFQAISAVVPPNTINDTASFRIKGDVSARVGLELTLMGARTTGLPGEDLKAVLASLRVTYRLANRFAIFWSAQFLGQNANVILPESISQGGIFAGIEYTFSPTAEEVARRRAEDN